MQYNRFIYIIIVSVLFGACKSVGISTQNLLPVPDTFIGQIDSASYGELDWRIHFQDTVLQSLIKEGLQSNLEIKKAIQRVEMSKAGLRYAKGLSLPFVVGTGSAGIRRFSLYSMDGVGNFDTNYSPNINSDQTMSRDLPDFLVGFQANWEIDVWGKLKNKKRAALSRYLGSIEGNNWLITNIVSDVAFLYYELLAVEREISILNETNSLQERGLEVIRLQKEAGSVSELAVNQFESQYFNFLGLTQDAFRRKNEIENQLNILLGRYPEQIRTDSSLFDQEIEFSIPVGNPALVLSQRADIRQAELELLASKADLNAARAAFYPSLNIQGMLGFQSFNAAFFAVPESFTYQVFGSLLAPLLNRSAIKVDLEFTRASQQEAFFDYQQTLIRAYTEVFQQTFVIDNLQKLVEVKEKELDALQRAAYNADQLFSTGRANYLEVILVRKSMLQSQFELLQARKEQLQANVNLYRSLGGG
jgi:outer membrane protein, multidrug efflux system